VWPRRKLLVSFTIWSAIPVLVGLAYGIVPNWITEEVVIGSLASVPIAYWWFIRKPSNFDPLHRTLKILVWVPFTILPTTVFVTLLLGYSMRTNTLLMASASFFYSMLYVAFRHRRTLLALCKALIRCKRHKSGTTTCTVL